MAWTQGNTDTLAGIDRVRGIAYGVLGLGVFFNFGALVMTMYMLEHFSHVVYETNPFPAFVFSNFGYAPMVVVISMFWMGVFAIMRYWGKRHGKKEQLFLVVLTAIVLTSVSFMDFANNFYYICVHCLPTLIN